MKHKFFIPFIASAACLILSGCYEMMLVPVYVSDHGVNPGGYTIGQLDNKGGFDLDYGNGSIDAPTRSHEPRKSDADTEWPAPKAGNGAAAMMLLLERARLDGHLLLDGDTLHNADSAIYTDTVTFASTDEEKVADWMLARIYERYIVAIDFDRRSATYICRAYRRKER